MNLKDFSNVEYINLVTYKKDKTPVTTPVIMIRKTMFGFS